MQNAEMASRAPNPVAFPATRVLPAHVYDALELSAAMYGGIGCGVQILPPDKVVPREEAVPMCYLGHLRCAGVIAYDAPVVAAFGIHWAENDDAVIELLCNRNEHYVTGRISFDEWCKALNVVRGPEPLRASERSEAHAEESFSLSFAPPETRR